MSDLLESPLSAMVASRTTTGVGVVTQAHHHFSTVCHLTPFGATCTELGFANSVFLPNESLHSGSRNYDKFSAALEEEDQVTLGLVFHGTHENNIPAILRDGLDENLRAGQAYGPGEYFATDPRISYGYCKGGSKMVVFVVVMPTTRTHEGIVVVQNNNHQLAIGTLQFDSYDPHKIVDFQALNHQVAILRSPNPTIDRMVQNEQDVTDSIIQYFVKNRIDIASEIYLKHFATLSPRSKGEIWSYVRAWARTDEPVEVLFPSLTN